MVVLCVPDTHKVLLVAGHCQPVTRGGPRHAGYHFLLFLDFKSQLKSVEQLLLVFADWLLLDAVDQNEANVADRGQASALWVKLGVKYLVGVLADCCQTGCRHQALRAVVVAQERVLV